MKNSISFLKVLSFLFTFLIANAIYSQCGAGYSATVNATGTTCIYTFSAAYLPIPIVTNVGWQIYSTGAYGTLCDAFTGNNVNRTFCFSGTYDVVCTLTFAGGAQCTITLTNVNISCTGAWVCDPDPTDPEEHPCPVVEITYVEPVFCPPSDVTVSGCQWTNGCSPSTYCISCGWTWAILIPNTTMNCDPFTYTIQYDSLIDCGSTCVSHEIYAGTPFCISAKQNEPIYIIADGNHCCLPAGYRRAFIWTPVPNGSAGTIRDPTPSYGICGANRCPTSGNCTENQLQMCETAGWPITYCFRGGGPKIEDRSQDVLAENARVEQNVIIYNIQGIEVFKGNWKFGDPANFYMSWPNNVFTGLYIVKFQNSEKLIKLFKF